MKLLSKKNYNKLRLSLRVWSPALILGIANLIKMGASLESIFISIIFGIFGQMIIIVIYASFVSIYTSEKDKQSLSTLVNFDSPPPATMGATMLIAIIWALNLI